jgi:hypothetical protein
LFADVPRLRQRNCCTRSRQNLALPCRPANRVIRKRTAFTFAVPRRLVVLPHEQKPNPYITAELCFRFHYFAMRKMHLAMRDNALAIFPGGFGTMDELFELLTLQQTRKAPGGLGGPVR